MRSEGFLHLVENIFGYLDNKTVVECRKVSKLWHESLEWISLVKFLLEFGDKLAKYHRSVLKDPEEKVLAIISGWKKGVQNNEKTASIEDLRELKNSLGKSLKFQGKFGKNAVNVKSVKLLKVSLEKIIYPDGRFWRRSHEEAIQLSDVKLLKFLYSTSYNENYRDWKGGTAFHWACSLGTGKTARWILALSTEDEPIDLNARNGDGMTALHLACSNYKVFPWMLRFAKYNDTIDMNARDNKGMTPFHLALGRIQMTKLFLDFSKENGRIDLNARDNEGSTAFHIACKAGKAAKAILDFTKENDGIDLNATDLQGMTAFHVACKRPYKHHVKLILDYSKENDTIDLNARDNNGMTGLHMACEKGRVKSVNLMLDFSRENNGIDLNVRDENGRTAFWRACALGRKRIINLLLNNWKELDIDIRSKNNQGDTALDVLNIDENEGLKEVKTILEEEYSKMDSSEPPSKKAKK